MVERRRRWVLLVGAGTSVVALTTTTGCVAQQHRREPPASSPPQAAPADPAAHRVLHRWDERRAAAYAAGRTAWLRRLYVPGSRAGERDVRRLRRYVDRGLTVTGMRMQLLELDVLARRRDRLLLRVTDRLVGATVVGPGMRKALPRDTADTALVRLTHTDRGWRVVWVQPVS